MRFLQPVALLLVLACAGCVAYPAYGPSYPGFGYVAPPVFAGPPVIVGGGWGCCWNRGWNRGWQGNGWNRGNWGRGPGGGGRGWHR